MIDKFNIKKVGKEKIIFTVFFIILGFVLIQIPINVLEGAKVKFTLFDVFAPITGAFLGSTVGAVAVILMQSVNLAVHGFSGVQTDSFLKLIATLRFLPLIFGVLYFSARTSQNGSSQPFGFAQGKLARTIDKAILLVPMLSIFAFVLHPIGRTVWFYSLFWLIPILCYPLRDKFLFTRALGSTFTAHAAGGAVWIWAFNLPATIWQSLIPVVILERSIFALGISASYILINNVLGYLSSQNIIPIKIFIDKKYVFFKK